MSQDIYFLFVYWEKFTQSGTQRYSQRETESVGADLIV